MNQKCKIVLLETDKHAKDFPGEENLSHNSKIKLMHTRGSLSYAYIHHLYVLSDEKPKNNEWFYDTRDKHISNNNLASTFFSKKIIATTNPELTNDGLKSNTKCLMATLPKDFIDKYCIEYNKSNKIEEILVEFEKCVYSGKNSIGCSKCNYNHNCDNKQLKINSDNTISIKMIKDTWNREEVKQIIRTIHFRLKSNAQASDKDIKELL